MTDWPMSDPTFETRAELEDWAGHEGLKANVLLELAKAVRHPVHKIEALSNAIALVENIKRVTLAHAHLLKGPTNERS